MRKKGKTVIWICIILILFFALTVGFNCIDRRLGEGFFRYGESVGALIAAALVVNELRRDAEAEEKENKIQQSRFIKDFNQAFITNPDMMFIERALEAYYGHFRKYVEDNKIINEDNTIKYIVPKPTDLENQNAKLRALFSEPGTNSRQRLINYLVYLEGLATVIRNEAMTIENVDSLLGYRFFIAVNNPIVCELELEPFKNDYRGIHTLGEDWVNYRSKKFAKRSAEETKYGDFLIPMQKAGFSFKNKES